MGEYWTRYFLNNRQRMSKRQMKKVEKLEEEILDALVAIEHFERKIEINSEKIDHIKNGGEKSPKNDFESEILF